MINKHNLDEELLNGMAAAAGATSSSIKKLINGADVELDKVAELKKYQVQINDAFKAFLNAPIPEEVKLHELTEKSVLIRLFDYEPPAASDIFVTASRKAGTLPYMTFALAKVLSSGPESVYKAGDVIKLRDFETRTLKNPKNELWNNNSYSKSNLKKIGEAPPEYTSAAMAVYGPRMFMVNPLSLEIKPEDWITFKITDMNIENKIKEPLKLLTYNK